MGGGYELTITERIGLIVYLFSIGRRMTIREIASLSGLTFNGAWRMVTKLSRVIPLLEEGGLWAILPDSLPPPPLSPGATIESKQANGGVVPYLPPLPTRTWVGGTCEPSCFSPVKVCTRCDLHSQAQQHVSGKRGLFM